MGLKNDLQRELGVEPRIRMGGPGSLDIYLDGKLIFSKKQTGRLPSSSEILACIRAMQKKA